MLPYPVWALVLVVTGLAIAYGTARGAYLIAWCGHLAGVVISSALAFSVWAAASFDSEPWSGVWPLVVVTLVHMGRAFAAGQHVRVDLRVRSRRGR